MPRCFVCPPARNANGYSHIPPGMRESSHMDAARQMQATANHFDTALSDAPFICFIAVAQHVRFFQYRGRRGAGESMRVAGRQRQPGVCGIARRRRHVASEALRGEMS